MNHRFLIHDGLMEALDPRELFQHKTTQDDTSGVLPSVSVERRKTITAEASQLITIQDTTTGERTHDILPGDIAPNQVVRACYGRYTLVA